MPKINILPREVYELIAAGEVVERPSSAVKELVENSLDAGADSITVEIVSGGIKYIRVTDNGSGILREDVKSAFISHATSKIKLSDDLDKVATLGFRGEAIASIAAVSRMEMLTKSPSEQIGTLCINEGGRIVSFEDAGCPDGTTVIVRNLFYNVPARMKFLKKDFTEANAVCAVMERVALSNPQVSFKLIRDGKQVLFTPGDGKLISAIHAVYGSDFSSGLIYAEGSAEGVSVKGYVCAPLHARPNRNMQIFFVNGRIVRTKTGIAALEEAYKDSAMVGKYPSCVLNISLPYSCVDVNVHPAKTEVRFANEKDVFSAVYCAAKNALEQRQAKPYVKPDDVIKQRVAKDWLSALEPNGQQVHFGKSPASYSIPVKERPAVVRSAPAAAYTTPSTEPSVLESCNIERKPEPKPEAKTEEKKAAAAPPEQETHREFAPAEDIRVIGEVFKTYIIVQSGSDMLLIDKHAAHERILYDQFKEQYSEPVTQLLLAPVTVKLSRNEYAAVLDNLDLIRKIGFDVEDFGGGSVIINEFPALLEGTDLSAQLTEIAGYLAENKGRPVTEQTDWIFHSAACRAAIKAGDNTEMSELTAFAEKVLAMPDVKYCPHGRPVCARLTRRDIEKLFGRV